MTGLLALVSTFEVVGVRVEAVIVVVVVVLVVEGVAVVAAVIVDD